MIDEVAALARAVQEARSAGGQFRYGDGLKAQVAAYWRRRRREGALAKDVARALGLHPVQLGEWSRRYPESSFRSVAVIDDRPSAAAVSHRGLDTVRTPGAARSTLLATPPIARSDVSTTCGLSLISPRGWRVEGLDLTLLVQLIEKLS